MSEVDYSKYVRREGASSSQQEDDVAVRRDMVEGDISLDQASTMAQEPVWWRPCAVGYHHSTDDYIYPGGLLLNGKDGIYALIE